MSLWRYLVNGRWSIECLINCVIWSAMNFLGSRHLSYGQLALLLGCSLGSWAIGELFRRWERRWRRWVLPIEIMTFVAGWWVMPAFIHARFSLSKVLYGVFLLGVMRLVVWAWLRKSHRDGYGVGESWRLLLVGGVGVGVMIPLLTDRFLGGTDAVWYSYMADDYRNQLWHGVFPIFVGQGADAFNGGIHPIRSAPAFTFLVGLWDVLSLHALPLFSLQHLAALTAALGGAFTMYFGLVRLNPGSRWLAAWAAVLYTTAPSILSTLYSADMYMTYLAAATLPGVFCANAEAIVSEGKRGLTLLAVSLAMTWLCHPPTAIYATLLTLFLQLGRLAYHRLRRQDVRTHVVATMWFVGLAVYYFWSMAERPRSPGEGVDLKAAAQCIGLLGAIASMIRWWWTRRWWWWAPWAASLGMLWVATPAWGYWLAISAVVMALLSWPTYRWATESKERSVLAALVVCLSSGALAAWSLVHYQPLPQNVGFFALMKLYAAHAGDFIRPVSAEAVEKWDCQPGLSLLGCSLGGLFYVLSGRKRGTPVLGLFVMALIGLSVLFWRVPWLTELCIGYFPTGLGQILSLPLNLRLLPVWSAIATVVGFLLMGMLAQKNRRWAFGIILLSVGTAVWSTAEARKFVRRGFTATASRQITRQLLMPENRVAYRFIYDLLRLPDYFCNGGNDWRLESRILDARGQIVAGPEEAAKRMEMASSTTVIKWKGRPIEPSPAWLELEPSISVPAGKTILLRFEFPDPIPPGFLIFKSPRFYREFELPASGMAKAFGTGAENGKVLTLANSGLQADNISVYFSRNSRPKNEDMHALVPFANVTISPFDSEALPVQVDSLIPYRARLTMPVEGYLETPRVMLPGYVATVDGRVGRVAKSAEGLVAIPLSPGPHDVVLRFRGTLGLRFTYWLSLAVALVGAILLIRRAGPRPREWFDLAGDK